MTQRESVVRRPWTVVVLSAWSAIGLVWAFLFSDGWQITDLLSLAVSVFFIRAYWRGQRWAFHLTFASAVLWAIYLLVSVVVFPERSSFTDKVFSAATVVAMIYLLRHPATKRFLLLDEKQVSSRPPGPPDRGGRLAQAAAVSIFGILAVALPLLWTVDMIGGVWLLAGLVACVGAGL